jgi:membrane protein YdbS with pleckstrin-like domain
MSEQHTVDERSVAEGQLIHVLPLQASRSSNISAAIALILMLPLALLASVAALAVLPQVLTSWWALIGEVAFIALATGLDWVVYRIFREAFPGRCYLGLTPSEIVLRHPLLLRRRLEIPFADVDRVAVNSSESPGFWEPRGFTLEKEKRGVTWVASDEETVEALDVTTRFFLPLASHVQADEPNVAVALSRPIDLRELRRKPISSRGLLVRRLCDVELARGFLARVKDPEAAAKVFGERGLLGKLGGEQERLIDPTEDDGKRFRRWRLRMLVGRVLTVVVAARLIWSFIDGFDL